MQCKLYLFGKQTLKENQISYTKFWMLCFLMSFWICTKEGTLCLTRKTIAIPRSQVYFKILAPSFQRIFEKNRHLKISISLKYPVEGMQLHKKKSLLHWKMIRNAFSRGRRNWNKTVIFYIYASWMSWEIGLIMTHPPYLKKITILLSHYC